MRGRSKNIGLLELKQKAEKAGCKSKLAKTIVVPPPVGWRQTKHVTSKRLAQSPRQLLRGVFFSHCFSFSLRADTDAHTNPKAIVNVGFTGSLHWIMSNREVNVKAKLKGCSSIARSF